MECELNPRIPYTELSHIIKRQKEVRVHIFTMLLERKTLYWFVQWYYIDVYVFGVGFF